MRYRYEVDVLGCQFQSPHLQLPRIARETLSKRNAIYIYMHKYLKPALMKRLKILWSMHETCKYFMKLANVPTLFKDFRRQVIATLLAAVLALN